jgi:hypothetical protein
VVKPIVVLVDTPRTLLQVQELLKHTELGPWHLVAVAKSGGEFSPQSTGGLMKLLGHVQSLLELDIVQEPKLGLELQNPQAHQGRSRQYACAPSTGDMLHH